MCGRVYVKRSIAEMVARFSFADPAGAQGLANQFPRYNGAPQQSYPIIVVDEIERGSTAFTSARWGFRPRWMKKTGDGPMPINAKCETVATGKMFASAYRTSRALLPIDGFFEWHDIYGRGKDKQPYAIAMADGSPFALAAIWQDWRDSETGEVIKTFAIITCPPNAMMAKIHNRMPVILAPENYNRWMFDEDPADLMRPFDENRMTMWKIDRKVGKVSNDTPDIIDPITGDDLFD